MDAFLKGGQNIGSSKTVSTSATSKAGVKKFIPWVEKYRPKSVKDVVFQEEVTTVLTRTLQDGNLPNLLFYGPPGTGKTSTILAVARQLFGADLVKTRVLELNASDERGIQVVREKVKTFAQQAVASSQPDGKHCPPIKLVILDEADSMTHSAQAALRRTMEKESKTTRFCLICNYISRIIEPLTSRCIKFRFKPLTGAILQTKLKEICTKENVLCSEEAISMLVSTSGGDMRMAITTLQSAARFKGKAEVSQDDILEISGVIPDQFIDAILQACYSDSYDKLEHTVKDLISEGFAAAQLINQLLDRVVVMDTLTDTQKSVIAERLGLIDRRLCDGADEYLQIMDLTSVIMKQLCHPETN